MIKLVLAAVAAVALFAAPPVFAGCKDCQNCPQKMASADKAEKKEAVACPCGDGKECKCGDKCECAHCSAAKKCDKCGKKGEGAKT